MRRSVIAVVALVMVTVPHAMAASATSSLRVAGDVRVGVQPVESALVISFGLSSFSAVRTWTNAAGVFDFPPLPAGAYRVIAVKSGFAPAVATISPTAEDRPLRLVLHRGKATKEATDQIWEIRRSLPSDILRELDSAMVDTSVPEEDAGFAGEMKSLTSIDTGGDGGTLAQTHLALSSSLPAGWRVDIDGSHSETSEQAILEDHGATRGLRSSGVAVSLSSDRDSRVQLASRSNMFTNAAGTRDVALESHRIEWSRPGTEVAVHYRQNENLLPEQYAQGALELEGETRVWGSERSDVGIGIRFVQATSGWTNSEPLRLADLTTSASHRFGRWLEVRYGLSARLGVDELASWSPETTALLRISENTSLIVGGQVKMTEGNDGWMLWPAIVQIEESGSGFSAPRYRYGLGVVSSSEASELSALVSITEIDDPMLLVFDDLAADVWDAYVLETGDRHEEIKLRYRRNFVSDRIAVDVRGHAARTQGLDETSAERSMLQSRVRSIYIPSGTSVEVSYRKLDQPLRDGITAFDLAGERLNLRMGQDLHLPLDLTVLFGVDLVRTPVTTPELEADELRHRYVGGVAFAF